MKITKQGDVFCFIKFEIDKIIVVSKCNAFKICPTKKSVIRTIFKMIADGMNNAQNEWVCNITERFRERTMFCNFFFCYFFFTCTESSYFQEHFTFVTAVSLENLDMSNRKVVIRTYKGSTVAGLARRTSKEGVLISPSTINLESFDIDIKFVLRICILKLAFQNW